IHLISFYSKRNDKIRYILDLLNGNNKIDINLKDNDGDTPLHFCCCDQKNYEIMNVLLSRNVDTEIENNNLKTPKQLLFDKIEYLKNKKNKNEEIEKDIKKCLKLICEYEENGTIWKKERHYIFSNKFKQNIFSFLLCL